MPNLVKKLLLWYIPERRESFTSPSAEVKSEVLQERPAKRQSICIEYKPDSPEGADTAASELQKLSLLKKAGEQQVDDPADAATTEHEKPIEPFTVDSIDSEQTLRCFLPNQPARNQWNFQEKMERHFSVETKFHFESSDPFTFLPKFDHCLAK